MTQPRPDPNHMAASILADLLDIVDLFTSDEPGVRIVGYAAAQRMAVHEHAPGMVPALLGLLSHAARQIAYKAGTPPTDVTAHWRKVTAAGLNRAEQRGGWDVP